MKKNLTVYYEKTGFSRYIAHLDTTDIICKALRRISLPCATTSGCHVRPKIQFGSALPLGHASLCEKFMVVIEQDVDPEYVKQHLKLPEGMRVTSAEISEPEKCRDNAEKVGYNLYFLTSLAASAAEEYLKSDQHICVIKKGRKKSYRLSEALVSISLQDAIVKVVFRQGVKNVPSASMVINALTNSSEAVRDNLRLVERTFTTTIVMRENSVESKNTC